MAYKDPNKKKEADAAYRAANREKCRKANRTHYRQNSEKLRRKTEEWWQDNPGKRKHYALMASHGISLEQFNQMLADQDGECPICGTTQPGGKGWHVDHCHTTGKIRGVLCHPCNSMLGFAHDNPASLRRAADFLEYHSTPVDENPTF